MREIRTMRIACPSCKAEYDVPETMLAGRNAVRCARCGEEWRPLGIDPAEALPAVIPAESPAMSHAAPATMEPEAEDEHFAPADDGAIPLTVPSLFVPPRTPRAVLPKAPPRRRGGGIVGGWIVTIVILVALGYGAYAWRDRMMEAWPPSTRLYAALGLVHH
jgi:predicted Zn finger-like uncharacterized protein